MKCAAIVVVVFACKSGEPEQAAKAHAPEPTLTAVADARVGMDADTVRVDAAVRLGSLEERQALARKIRALGFTVRASGADETVLEITSKAEGCRLSNLTELLGASGYTLALAGFTKLKCVGKSDAVDLVDERGVPVRAAGVTAKRLAEDYGENEIAADLKYRGKSLRVTGTIESVGKALGEPYVTIAGGPLGVHASFESEAPLVSLKKGQAIIVRCIGGGMPLAPKLNECAIEQSGSKSAQP